MEISVGIVIGLVIGFVVGALMFKPGKTAAVTTAGSGEVAADDGDKKTIFVGNLWFKANERGLRELFEPYGTVFSVRIMTDRDTRRPRGFGFVEMDEEPAMAAIEALNGSEYGGRAMSLSEANERKPKGGA